MRGIFFACVGLLFCSPLLAQDEFREYTVSIGWGGTVPMDLPVARVEAYRKDILSFSKHIKECERYNGEADNPLLGKSQKLTVDKGVAGCVLKINSYSTWLYECQLPSREHLKLGTSMEKRARTDELLGDYSDDEKEILFNKKFCRQKREA